MPNNRGNEQDASPSFNSDEDPTDFNPEDYEPELETKSTGGFVSSSKSSTNNKATAAPKAK